MKKAAPSPSTFVRAAPQRASVGTKRDSGGFSVSSQTSATVSKNRIIGSAPPPEKEWTTELEIATVQSAVIMAAPASPARRRHRSKRTGIAAAIGIAETSGTALHGSLPAASAPHPWTTGISGG